MTRLSQAITKRQAELGLTDRAATAEISAIAGHTILQQTYSTWKRGTVPRPPMHAPLAEWLGLPVADLETLVDEAIDEEPAINLAALANVRQYGKIADRKTGKYRFGTARQRVPSGRYKMRVDTKIMEPVLAVGATIWLDPMVAPQAGNDVVVHADGFGWLGTLETWDAAGARLGDTLIKNVEAIHVIVLASRI
jgi:hypothetical protein